MSQQNIKNLLLNKTLEEKRTSGYQFAASAQNNLAGSIQFEPKFNESIHLGKRPFLEETEPAYQFKQSNKAVKRLFFEENEPVYQFNQCNKEIKSDDSRISLDNLNIIPEPLAVRDVQINHLTFFIEHQLNQELILTDPFKHSERVHKQLYKSQQDKIDFNQQVNLHFPHLYHLINKNFSKMEPLFNQNKIFFFLNAPQKSISIQFQKKEVHKKNDSKDNYAEIKEVPESEYQFASKSKLISNNVDELVGRKKNYFSKDKEPLDSFKFNWEFIYENDLQNNFYLDASNQNLYIKIENQHKFLEKFLKEEFEKHNLDDKNKELQQVKKEQREVSPKKEYAKKTMSTKLLTRQKRTVLSQNDIMRDLAYKQIIQKSSIQGCKCEKNNCLKLHCKCFKNKFFCEASCECISCKNNSENKTLREKMTHKSRDIHSENFKITFLETKRDGEVIKLTKGCTCSKNNCLKNYCECRKYNLSCSTLCKCSSCQNDQIMLEPHETIKLKKKVTQIMKKKFLEHEQE